MAFFKFDKNLQFFCNECDRIIINKNILESTDYEDAIRNAIVIGGDSDTIGAITSSISAAHYGIPLEICDKALEYLDDYLIKIHDDFNKKNVINE